MLFGLLLVVLTACVTDGQIDPKPPVSLVPNQPTQIFGPDGAEDYGPRKSGTTRIAVLVPMSGPYSEIGTQLWDGASLALFDSGIESIELLPHDTKGTPDGAAAAAEAALDDGVDAVVGPLFATSVATVRPLLAARNVRAIAFSNNRSVAGGPMFLIGNHPESQIDALLTYLTDANRRRIALLGPDTRYLRLLKDRLIQADKAGQIELVDARLYRSGESYTDIAKHVQSITQYNQRARALQEFVGVFRKTWEAFDDPDQAMQAALSSLSKRIDKARIFQAAYDAVPRRANGWSATEEDYSQALTELVTLYGKKLAAADTPADAMAETLTEIELKETLGDANLDAVLLPIGGRPLLVVAPMFKYFNAEQPRIWLLGTNVWDTPGIEDRRDLNGSHYVTTSSPDWAKFQARMEAAFGYRPDQIATAAYDAVKTVIEAKRDDGDGFFDEAFLTREEGFDGINGTFRFLRSGVNERSLHIVQLQAGDRRHVYTWQPAPTEPPIEILPVSPENIIETTPIPALPKEGIPISMIESR